MNKQMQEELTCPICLEMFSKPILVLPCQHNLCQECAEDIFQSCNNYRCPTCRETFQLPGTSGVSQLPRNRTLENLIEIHQNTEAKDTTEVKNQIENVPNAGSIDACGVSNLSEMATTFLRNNQFGHAKYVLEKLDAQVRGMAKIQIKIDMAKCLIRIPDTGNIFNFLQQMHTEAIKNKDDLVQEDWVGVIKDCRDLLVKIAEKKDLIASMNVLGLVIKLCEEIKDINTCIQELVLSAAVMQDIVCFVTNPKLKEDFDSFGFSLLQEVFSKIERMSNVDSHFRCRQLTRCLKCAGYCHNKLQEYRKSVDVHQRAITLMKVEFKQDAVLYRLYGICYHNLGVAYSKLKNKEKATSAFQTAIHAYEQVLDWDNMADKEARINLCIQALTNISL